MKTILLTLTVLIFLSINGISQQIYEPGKNFSYLDYNLLGKHKSELKKEDTVNVIYLGLNFDKVVLKYDNSSNVCRVTLDRSTNVTNDEFSNYMKRLTNYFKGETFIQTSQDYFLYKDYTSYLKCLSKYNTGISVGRKKIKEFETVYYKFCVSFEKR